jgi:putative DNA primase/helicase
MAPLDDKPTDGVDPYTATRWTDLGNAELLVRTYGDRIRWVPLWEKWLVWDGTRWARDYTGAVTELAAAVARSLLDLAAVRSGDERKAAVKWALMSEGRSRIEAMVALARSAPGIPVLPDQLDADPWLLNAANGTVDLRTGRLRRHDPADLITKTTGVAYRPDARAPVFDAFLARVQPDPDMRDYLARLFGHTLVGAVLEHLLAVFHGAGSNGKTTLVELVMSALGEYADLAEPDLLLSRGETHPTGRADLQGKRLVVATETDEGRRLNESLVKSLTGGDRIKARHLFKDFFTFPPSHSVILVTNHRPEVRGVEHAIWRRIRLVPWSVVIPDSQVDKRLPDRLRDELPGVLAWMLAGCADWQDRDGLDDPDEVLTATEGYRDEQDALGGFLADVCTISPGAHVRTSKLREAYTDWCKANGIDALPANVLGERLRLRGFTPGRDGRARSWQGFGLAANAGGVTK